MRICIIKSREFRGVLEPVPKILYETKPYLKKLKYSPRKKMDFEELVCRYINHGYGKKGVSCVVLDLEDINPKDFDLIWSGITYWSANYVDRNQWKEFVKKAKTFKNKLVPTLKWNTYADDKCLVYKELNKKLKIPMTETVCKKKTAVTSNKQILDLMKRYKWKRAFLKPIPSAGGRDTYNTERETGNSTNITMRKYIKDVTKMKDVDSIVVQKFQEDFATTKHPEVRTIWVNDKVVKIARTTGMGHLVSLKDSIPKSNQIYKESSRIIKYLSKYNLVMFRLDWGYDKSTKQHFFNEIQPNPSIWLEKAKKTFKTDKLVGDRLIHLLKHRN
jgi:hypothetical protein